MRKRIIVIAVMLIAIALTGLIYLTWKSQTTRHHNTIRFTQPLNCRDNEAAEDVGNFNCTYKDKDPFEGWKTLLIQLSNAYPDYSVHCNFTLKNIGNQTDAIEAVTVSDPTGNLQWKWVNQYTEGFLWKDINGNNLYDPGEEIINITLTELVGLKLIPNETMTAQIDVQITDNAQQSQTYGFQVNITYEEKQ